MGQYYTPVIIYSDDSIAMLNSHAFDSGAKLTEHSWISNPLVNAVYSRIHNKPRKVAWIGDYADGDYQECGEPYTRQLPYEEFMRFYTQIWGDDENCDTEISPSQYAPKDLEIITHSTRGMYLINHSLREYLDLGTFIERCTIEEGIYEGDCMDPLPLLTACGNGRGGGDFRKSENNIGYDQVGIWAFHCLELSNTPPNSYSERNYDFIEAA